MAEYKSILTGYLNDSREDSTKKYLVITNVSDEPITVLPGGRLYLNLTPKAIRDKNPKVPMFSKSVKMTEQSEPSRDVDPNQAKDVADSIPF